MTTATVDPVTGVVTTYPRRFRVPLDHGYAAFVLEPDQRQGWRSEQVMAPTEEQERELSAMADTVADRMADSPIAGWPRAKAKPAQSMLLGVDGRPMGSAPQIVVPRPVVRRR